ncbi:hypothetical protein ACLOJK_016969 [Asimina triloba]
MGNSKSHPIHGTIGPGAGWPWVLSWPIFPGKRKTFFWLLLPFRRKLFLPSRCRRKMSTRKLLSKALDPRYPPKPEAPKPPKSDLPPAIGLELPQRPFAKGKSERRMVREDVRREESGGRCERERIRHAQSPASERRKQKEYEVFVGGLDRDAVEEDLEKVFKKYGEIVEVRLVRRPHSNQNKGFAFVRFLSVEQAKKAADVRFTTVNGKRCEVTRNNDNETLHLRNICTTWTQDQLVEKLKVYELENLEEVHLIDDPNNKGRNRGYAFLGFSTHNDAVAACTKLQKRSVFFGTDVRAEVAFAKSAVEPDEDFMAQFTVSFIIVLPLSWSSSSSSSSSSSKLISQLIGLTYPEAPTNLSFGCSFLHDYITLI